MNLFQRAAVGANLSAVERGIYQFAQLMLLSLGPLGSLPFINDLLKSGQVWMATGVWHSFDYGADLRWLLYAVIASACAAWQHWKNARHDPPQGPTLSSVADQILSTYSASRAGGDMSAFTTTPAPTSIPAPPPDVVDPPATATS